MIDLKNLLYQIVIRKKRMTTVFCKGKYFPFGVCKDGRTSLFKKNSVTLRFGWKKNRLVYSLDRATKKIQSRIHENTNVRSTD